MGPQNKLGPSLEPGSLGMASWSHRDWRLGKVPEQVHWCTEQSGVSQPPTSSAAKGGRLLSKATPGDTP